MSKREYGIDYEIAGTLSLCCRNQQMAAWRARGLLTRAIADLEEIGIHCEMWINEPFDVRKRYGRAIESEEPHA